MNKKEYNSNNGHNNNKVLMLARVIISTKAICHVNF